MQMSMDGETVVIENTVTIVGQGYVGLPLAEAASAAGLTVWGLDTAEARVEALNSGRSHVDDLTDDDIAVMLANGYRATADPGCIAESSVVVICVPTPLGDAGAPDLGAVEAATRMVGEQLRPGTLVVLESTTYPGTTDEICLPILEELSGLQCGSDFLLAFSPERVNPGDPVYGIKNTPKLVGGVTPVATAAAEAFYSRFIDTVVALSGAKEAETAKLLENTFRHVNIALVNEMAKVCHELGIDIWEVIRGAATKPFGFMKFTPGPGVGGHCIPIDPNYLSFEVRKELGYPFRFVELAQEINHSMPEYVARRIADLLNDDGKALNGAKVLLLGVTYKANIADQRESPAREVGQWLLRKKTDLRYHDPFVEAWHLDDQTTLDCVRDLPAALAEADLVVLLQAHKAYDIDQLQQASRVFFDTRGVAGPGAHRL